MAEAIKINDATWRFEDGGVRFFLLCGKEKAALIDTGMNAPDAKEQAEKLTDLPIILINTHADRDHISGNGAFEEFCMSPAEEDNYRDNGGNGTIIPVKDGDVIDLGDRPLCIIDNPGHTPGSIAILDERYRVLIAGDSVQDGNIFMFGKYRNIDTYIDSLKRLKEYDGRYDEIYAMHGTVPVKPDLIDKLIGGAEQIRGGTAEGKKVDMFGNEVMLYKFPYAGFLCEVKEVL
ncbi:MAG: MBL fold metallo-hydrolase [Lachnospiraceae bacterium]|nr:MBL fold metallo-hydrolase [Lachnospiraceae bacterium]